MNDEAISRAIDRTVVASCCLHGAADDMRVFAASSSVREIPAEALQSEALRIEQLAESMEGLRA